MAIDVTVNFEKKFSYRKMQQLMAYLTTFNCESQALAIDANTEDIQSTGTKAMFINGQAEVCEEDVALDISADTEGTWTAWATATAYSVGDVRKNSLGNLHPYRCIVAHTSKASNEPGFGADWAEKWEPVLHTAINASGLSISANRDQWLMVTAKADGTLTAWVAGDEATAGNAILKVPLYDYKQYCVIGFMHLTNAAGAFVVGTTGLDDGSMTDLYINVTGPVFPHPDNWDKN